MQRRLQLAALCCWALAAAGAAAAAAPRLPLGERQPPRIRPFSLADVQLGAASEFAANFRQNNEFLLGLKPDDLMYNFRLTAGLPTPGASLGGWEASGSEVRGQFVGHYLSAVAFVAQHTGRADFLERGALLVRQLATVQAAHGNGYLSAFPKEHFDRLEALQPVWAPYYVVHKLLAGLLDQFELAGQEGALAMAKRMAAYHCGRVRRVLDVNGTDHWHQVLETEFGGMNEALYRLYRLTKDPDHAECAHWFDKPAFFGPLAEGRDPLPGLHANTHLAQVHGFTARYELTGDPQALAAAANFFGLLLKHHSFSTGGSNWGEHWGPEDALGDAIADPSGGRYTEESCTTYNALKLARTLFMHTGDPALADFYERALLNSVIGVQKLARDERQQQGLARAHPHAQRHPHPYSHTHSEATVRQDSHPHIKLAPQSRLHIHIHNSHFTNATATTHIHIHGGGGNGGSDSPQVVIDAGEAPEEAGEEARRRRALLAPVGDAAFPGAAAGAGGVQPPGPGVFLYYQPLGAGVTKNETWSGWGNPTDSFWCCYGTAVESFSKLADAIYFHHMPEDSEATLSSATSSSGEPAGGAGPAAAAAPGPLPPAGVAEDYPLPQLWVNQLASSSLRWSELRMVAHQEAEIYGPETAGRASLRFDIYPPDEALPLRPSPVTLPPGLGKERLRFVLHWRIPGWAKADQVQLRINGQNASECLQQAAPPAAAGAGGAGGAAAAPPFGAGARFCSLVRLWASGDVVEAFMPMRVAAEPLNDARREMQSLRAVMMGPLLMAGLTDGDRELQVDLSALEQALSLPDPTGLVSLQAVPAGSSGSPPPPAPLLLRLSAGGGVQLGGHGAPLEATFRLVAPLAGCPGTGGGSSSACSPHLTRRLLMEPGPAAQSGGGLHLDGPRVASFEAVARPGQYLTADPASGSLLLQQAAAAAGGAAAQTFLLRPGGGLGRSIALEPLSHPGAAVQLSGDGRQLRIVQPSPAEPATAFLLAPPAAAAYPPGARLLHGSNRDYLLLPYGQIQDERYTAYFNLTAPAGAAL